MSGEHKVETIRKRLAQTFKCFPSHHDNVSSSHFSEPLEILRQMPRNLVPVPDDAVLAHRGDGFEVFQGMADES
jgi:hypothetical protein